MSLSHDDNKQIPPVPPLVRVAVDAFGGDHAPTEIVRGAVLYARLAAQGTATAAHMILVGDPERLRTELADALGGDPVPEHITVHAASQIVAMDDHPTEALKKPDSSLTVAISLVKKGLADAVYSAGNTGAMLVLSISILEKVEGVRRPPIAAFLPQQTGRKFVLVDAGANLGCKPSYLLQFAVLGSLYAEHVFGYEKPRVGILSNGEEDSKGDELTKEANALFHAKAGEYGLNFIGNIEPHHAFAGEADVVVCDGFVGNVLLKGAEGMGEVAMHVLQKGLAAAATTDNAARAALQAAHDEIAAGIDYAEAGSAPLLGVNGVSMIAHGRSNARAVMNGIRVAVDAAQSPYIARVQEAFAGFAKREAAG
ncbi:MAG: phosphate acyltransferase PlsX [Akkermansiaceae bacterium]|nr:phosphate acyltransferase PlsX [Armatimonadota bacterium]